MNQRPQDYSFQRYLASKRTVDDRALNGHVWNALHTALAQRVTSPKPLSILEIGGGIGTMVERLIEDGRITAATYHLIDQEADNIREAAIRLDSRFAAPSPTASNTLQFHTLPSHTTSLATNDGKAINLSLYNYDLYDFLAAAGSFAAIDLIVAHAFLDLVDIPATLPLLTQTLSPGTLLYFTINFDGATILEPAIDPPYDALVEQVYHRTMDERVTNDKRSGDSHAGRHLFHNMQTASIQTLDAGSSDWVVIPHHGIYPHDEAYFLHFIIDTMYGALCTHPELEADRFRAWIEHRHAQIEQGELIYIAHQMDYLGVYQPAD